VHRNIAVKKFGSNRCLHEMLHTASPCMIWATST